MRSDGNPGQTGRQDTPPSVRDFNCPGSEMGLVLAETIMASEIIRDQQAGHRTVSDYGAPKLQQSPCNPGAIHTEHYTVHITLSFELSGLNWRRDLLLIV